VSDVDTAAADSLKALDPNRPIREADMARRNLNVRFGQKETFRDRATCAAGRAFNHSIATKFSIFISPLYRCWTFHLEFLCIYLHISRSISSQLASA
jgi:hypothetical protein